MRQCSRAGRDGSDLQAGAVVEHVQQLQDGGAGAAEEAVGRRVQLPEFADGLPLPAPHVGERARLWDGRAQPVVEGPVADLPAVHFVAEAPAEFAGRKGEGIGLRAAGRNQGAAQEGLLFGRPLAFVVAARTAREPRCAGARRACGEVGGAQLVEAGLADAERVHGLLTGEGSVDELFHRVAHMGDTQPVVDLCVHGTGG